jgi:hypothetical protein
MAFRTLLKCLGLGAVVAGIPLLPWYRLGVGVQPTVEWLTFPGIVVGYMFAGPHNLTTPMVTAADFLIYSACSYFVVRRWERRVKRDAS